MYQEKNQIHSNLLGSDEKSQNATDFDQSGQTKQDFKASGDEVLHKDSKDLLLTKEERLLQDMENQGGQMTRV